MLRFHFGAVEPLPSVQRWLVVVVCCVGLSHCAAPISESTVKESADRVVVHKALRLLKLYQGQRLLATYPVRLGWAPHGHKFQEGDGRTPEGHYVIDWRNPNSQFYKSLHITYPNQQDRWQARMRGVEPGGMIMIHGQPNRIKPPLTAQDYARLDWTNGCIAVSNADMDNIWRSVPDQTEILILP
jgi:murein L,D-transpeptidase YafK